MAGLSVALVTDELAAQVALYRKLMIAAGTLEEIQDPLVEEFKKMPPWQRELTLQAFQ